MNHASSVATQLALSLFATNTMAQVAFTAKSALTTGNAPRAVALGDFKNNHVLGLAIANASDGTVSIFQGIGDGTFGPKTDYATGMGSTSVVWATSGIQVSAISQL